MELGSAADDAVSIDLNQPMDDIRAQLTKLPVKSRVQLSGPIIVARDIAHAKLRERLESGEGLPQYIKDHPVRTTPAPPRPPRASPPVPLVPPPPDEWTLRGPVPVRGRLHGHVGQGQSLPAGDRCLPTWGGFYPGSIGGPAAQLAEDCIKKVELVESPELGMEAIYRIEVEDFAFIIVDDKGTTSLAHSQEVSVTIGKRPGL